VFSKERQKKGLRSLKPQPKPEPKTKPEAKSSLLTPALHALWLERFQEVVRDVDQQRPIASLPLRLRDWTLTHEDGQETCTLFLDRGQSWLGYDDFAADPRHLASREAKVDMADCVAVHKSLLLREDLMGEIPDSWHLAVSSAGEAPPLRDPEDFAAAVGMMVSIITWPIGATPKRPAPTIGRLAAVDTVVPGERVEIVLDTMAAPLVSRPQEDDAPRALVRVLLEQVMEASLLLFDPRNFAKT
jgi:hypothetical protein